MEVACLDLEGVLVPEFWIHVAEQTGIDALCVTTRDVADYDELMRRRLEQVNAHGLRLSEIQDIIAALEPLDGATGFLRWLQERFQVVIVSDTFYEFATPLMRKLGWPPLFCHRLETDNGGRLVGYRLRLPDQKRATVQALQGLEFRVIAAGDSYNDAGMLSAADAGILFRPPAQIAREFPEFPVTETYGQMRAAFRGASQRELG